MSGGWLKVTSPRRDVDMQDVARSLSKIARNDLPHIENRLNRIDIRLEGMDVNIAWSSRLLLGLTVAGVALTIGVIINIVFS